MSRTASAGGAPVPLPVSIMVWTLPDAVIENPGLLESQFEELRGAGFDGVAVYVRCSRYTWDDPPARAALARVGKLCRRTGLRLWAGPDPRFISRTLIDGTARSASAGVPACGRGAEILLFGDSTRAGSFPNLSPLIDQRFSVRCQLTPRHAHMFNEVALLYAPLGIMRCSNEGHP